MINEIKEIINETEKTEKIKLLLCGVFMSINKNHPAKEKVFSFLDEGKYETDGDLIFIPDWDDDFSVGIFIDGGAVWCNQADSMRDLVSHVGIFRASKDLGII